MPEIHLDISEQNKQIFEPIARQMIHKTLRELGADRKVGDNIYIDFRYSTVRSRTVRTMDTSLRMNKVHCDVEINTAPDGGKFHNFNFSHTPYAGITKNDDKTMKPMFFDLDGNIRIFEQFAPASITTTYTFQFTERSTVAGLAGIMNNRYGGSGFVESADVTYHYPIPPLLIKALFDIYKIKNLDMKFFEYLRRCSNNCIGYHTNRVMTKMQVVAQRTQAEATSSYEYMDTRPEERKTNRVTDSYELKLTHSLQLSIPNAVTLEFPIIINNELVPGDYIQADDHYVKPLQSLRQTSNVALYGEVQDNRISKFREAIRIPIYDDWIVPIRTFIKRFSYQEFYIAAFTLNETENDKGELIISNTQDFYFLDEEEMGDYAFHPIVDHFLLLQGPESLKNDCLFNVTVYKDNYPLDENYVSMDHYGNIHVRTNDPKAIHRLVISEISDIRKLNKKWLDPLIDWFNNNCVGEKTNMQCCAHLRVIDDLLLYLQAGGSLDRLKRITEDSGYFIKMQTLIRAVRRTNYSNMDVQLARYMNPEGA